MKGSGLEKRCDRVYSVLHYTPGMKTAKEVLFMESTVASSRISGVDRNEEDCTDELLEMEHVHSTDVSEKWVTLQLLKVR